MDLRKYFTTSLGDPRQVIVPDLKTGTLTNGELENLKFNHSSALENLKYGHSSALENLKHSNRMTEIDHTGDVQIKVGNNKHENTMEELGYRRGTSQLNNESRERVARITTGGRIFDTLTKTPISRASAQTQALYALNGKGKGGSSKSSSLSYLTPEAETGTPQEETALKQKLSNTVLGLGQQSPQDIMSQANAIVNGFAGNPQYAQPQPAQQTPPGSIIGNPTGGWEAVHNGTLGDRNNNPGNLRYTPEAAKWLGGQPGEKGFMRFNSPEEGVRAFQKLMFEGKTYRNLTLPEAINRYSPPSENSTGNYIEYMIKNTGIDPNKKLKDYTPEERRKLTAAMLKFESGAVRPVETSAVISNENMAQPQPQPQQPEAKPAQVLGKPVQKPASKININTFPGKPLLVPKPDALVQSEEELRTQPYGVVKDNILDSKGGITPVTEKGQLGAGIVKASELEAVNSELSRLKNAIQKDKNITPKQMELAKERIKELEAEKVALTDKAQYYDPVTEQKIKRGMLPPENILQYVTQLDKDNFRKRFNKDIIDDVVKQLNDIKYTGLGKDMSVHIKIGDVPFVFSGKEQSDIARQVGELLRASLTHEGAMNYIRENANFLSTKQKEELLKVMNRLRGKKQSFFEKLFD